MRISGRCKRFFLSILSFGIIFSLAVSAASGEGKRIRIVIVGDSTVQTYEQERAVRGWGQYIGDFFTADAEIINRAMSGRSTKTFISEGRWDEALADKGDYILIQFGHNDSHDPGRPESTNAATDFKTNLRKYADDARAAGAEPIFVTPMHRRLFKDGNPTEELKPYADAMKDVAREKNVMVVDLFGLSGDVLATRGDDGSADLYVGPEDRTHFSGMGARLMAKLVAFDLARQHSVLKGYIVMDDRVVRHVVLFKFKDDTSVEDVKKIEDAFRALPVKIDFIRDFEWGTNVSPENLAQGFTHCFFLTFKNEEDRNAYLPHPAHKDFGSILHPHLDKVLVIDYRTNK